MKAKLFCMLSLLLGLMYGCSELFNDDDFENNQTGSVIISLTDIILSCDAPCTVTLYDHTNTITNRVNKFKHRSCTVKKRYEVHTDTQVELIRLKDAVEDHLKDVFIVYECPFCDGYHIGKDRIKYK